MISLFGFMGTLIAQPKMSVVLQQNYSDAGIALRIENCGIYGLRGISASADGFIISTENNTQQYRVDDHGSAQFIPSAMKKQTENAMERPPLTAATFINNNPTILSIEDGMFQNADEVSGSVSIAGRVRVLIDATTPGNKLHYEEIYPGNLAFSDIVGIDNSGYLYVEVQLYMSEIPLRIQRQVLVLSPAGKLVNRLVLPQYSYCTTERDLQIDASGHLYCLLTDETSLSIVCWSGLTEQMPGSIVFPAEFNRQIHFNDFLKKEEPIVSAPQPLSKITSTGRTLALSIAESYVLHRYTCTATNLAPSGIRAPDGDNVQTPSWLVVGRNAHLPYQWGGFSSIAQFDAGLANGLYAGDISTASVSNYAVSVDCSGYVSRCWQLSSHYSTSMMPDISTQLASWDQLKPGDAILYASSHVRLFIGKSINGYLRVAESSARDWGVSYWSYTPAQLTGVYVPVSLNQMESQYSTQQPELMSAVAAGSKHVLTWKCDTTNVLGYRLYRSTDGAAWTMVMNETTLKSQTVSMTESAPEVSYRLSSVLRTTGNPESILSNAMIAGTGTASGKILIVDGFSRQLGSWRGAGHTFAVNYGMAIAGAGYSIETIKRSLIDSQTVSLQPYKGVVWIAGDQSTNEDTVLFKAERDALRKYLEEGGCLLISGSEIGYSVFMNRNVETNDFLNNYLKAGFVNDAAGTANAKGISGTLFADFSSINFAQTYMVSTPDIISPQNGGGLCLNYNTNNTGSAGAGVFYVGPFGQSSIEGKIIYIGFPLETIADESVFSGMISSSIYFFRKYPYVLSTSPTKIDTAILVSNSMTVQFSTAMDTQSVRSAFSITPSVAGSFGWTNNNKTLTFTPSQSLSFNTIYTIQFNSAVRSTGGYGLDQNDDGVAGDIYTFSFKTEPALLALKNPAVFPQVAIGDSTTLQIGVRNRSGSSITISSISNKVGLFRCTQSLPVTIKGGDSIQIPVVFKPQTYGTVIDTLFLNSTNGSIGVPLSGSSPTPNIAVSRSSIGYGSRVVDSATKGTFFITSLSINPVRVDSIKLRTKYFQISSFTMPQTLKLYDTLKVDLTFVPDSGRAYTDSVLIYNNSSTPIYRISLLGTGVGSSAVELTDALVPNKPVLLQNYPNPFNPTTTISFSLPVRAFVSLKIFNLVGREVAGLVNETKSPGAYSVQWNAAGCASGMYFYRLSVVPLARRDLVPTDSRNGQTGTFIDTKKLVLLK
jgi:cell wall-associated NlpC family hydrolase